MSKFHTKFLKQLKEVTSKKKTNTLNHSILMRIELN